MTQYEIYTKNQGDEKYEYIETASNIPQLNAALKILKEQKKDVKLITYYPDGTTCVSEYHHQK